MKKWFSYFFVYKFHNFSEMLCTVLPKLCISLDIAEKHLAISCKLSYIESAKTIKKTMNRRRALWYL